MQLGLLISILLHAAILGGALISIQSRPEIRVPEPEPVAVGMISPGEVTKVRLGVRTAKLLEAEPKESPKGEIAKKEAPRPKLAALAPPPPPPPPPPPVEQKPEPAAPKVAEPPPPPPVPPAEVQKKLEAEQQERDRQAALAAEKLKAEQQRQADQQKLAEEKRVADERQRAEEQEKAEAMKRAEEQKQADERKRAEEEQQRRAEEEKRAEEQRRQAELKKKRDDEKKRREAALKKKREEEKKRQEEEKKKLEAEAAKSKKWDADSISALLNKVPDKAAPPPPSAQPDQPTKNKGPTLGAPDGRDKQLSASDIAMIRQTIKSCVGPNWRVLSGGASAQETEVRIRIRFNQDGTLSAPPEIVNPERTPYFVAISESALRAVQQCEPYNLPPDKYDHWKDLIMKFSPRDMF